MTNATTKTAKKSKFLTQLAAVRKVLVGIKRGLTMGQIAEKASKLTKSPMNEACVSARFRDLKAEGVTITREKNKDGAFTYAGTAKS